MIKMFTKRMRNEKGFTLIELIVVIAILGILAAIAVPRFGGFTNAAKVSADEATAATILNAMRLHNAQTGQQTTEIQDLVTAGYIEDSVSPQSVEDEAFILTWTDDGNPIVSFGDKTIDGDNTEPGN